jgi:hypothetical protein
VRHGITQKFSTETDQAAIAFRDAGAYIRELQDLLIGARYLLPTSVPRAELSLTVKSLLECRHAVELAIPAGKRLNMTNFLAGLRAAET